MISRLASRFTALSVILTALWLQYASGSPSTGAASGAAPPGRSIADQDVPSTAAERARTPLPFDPNRVVYFIRPQEADSHTDHFLKDHYVLRNVAVPQNGKVFVFLPGTWAQPRMYQLVLDEAARAGYKAIGLEYPNDTPDPNASAVVQICARNPDPKCAARVRRARVSGGVADGGTRVTRANSIKGRLVHLLQYLRVHHPGDGWDRYLTDGRADWRRIALGGHSQGAGMAAFIAKEHRVARVALWSAPADYVLAAHSLAPWLSQPSATPAAAWYGMVHRDEPGAGRILDAYAALGIPEPPFSVPPITSGADPGSGPHQFVVTLPPARTVAGPFGAAHSSVVVDGLTPRGPNGRPVYAPLWDVMIGR